LDLIIISIIDGVITAVAIETADLRRSKLILEDESRIPTNLQSVHGP